MDNIRHSRDFLADVMERPAIKALVRQTVTEIALHPTECIVVGQRSSIQIRVGKGKRSWVSMRALVWMESVLGAHYREPPVFSTPSCGTAGCVNPAHQSIREIQPRVKVVQHVRAAS